MRSHLNKLELSNLDIVDTIEEMLKASIVLYPAAVAKNKLSKYNPHAQKINK